MDEPLSETDSNSAGNDLTKKVKAMQLTSRAKNRAETLANPQLPLWPETVRSIPNEIVRSALFTAKNRKEPRNMLRQAAIAVIGDGRITYTGDELRQDDETVWLQLIHLAKAQPLGEFIEFTPYSFCQNLKWSISGQSYAHLREVLTRLQATSLQVYSKRLGDGVSISMIPSFAWQDENDESLKRWRVRVAPELVVLFGDKLFTRVEWEQRLALPDGLATWLHGYLASHKAPYPIKLETIRKGAGLKEDGTRDDLRKTVKRALEALIKVGFLASYKIVGDMVHVERAKSTSVDL